MKILDIDKLKNAKIEEQEKEVMKYLDTLYDKLSKQVAENLDNTFYEFLINQGYHIDKPYNIKQLEELKNQLANEDKVLDCFEYTDFKKDLEGNLKVTRYIIPFFNSISCPLNENDKREIINRWKEMNKEDK